MVFCQKCKGSMATTDIVCPGCGYEFPPISEVRTPVSEDKFAFSPLAETALTISMLAAGFGALGAVIYAITALSQANLLAGLVLAPVAFFQQIGVIVLILRARR